MKFTYRGYAYRVTLALYLLAWLVYASTKVGTAIPCTNDVTKWTFPWFVLLNFSTAAILGWLAALEYMEGKK